MLSDFHREQAWERWLSTTSNGMRSVKELVLLRLRRIANAETLLEFDKSVKNLQASDLWHGENSIFVIASLIVYTHSAFRNGSNIIDVG